MTRRLTLDELPHKPLLTKRGAKNVRVIVRNVERGWFGELEPNKWGAGCLRRMPTQLWNELMDALPRCECGRHVSPGRAVRGAKRQSYCSDECAKRAIQRIQQRRATARRIEREAIAESIGQK